MTSKSRKPRSGYGNERSVHPDVENRFADFGQSKDPGWLTVSNGLAFWLFAKERSAGTQRVHAAIHGRNFAMRCDANDALDPLRRTEGSERYESLDLCAGGVLPSRMHSSSLTTVIACPQPQLQRPSKEAQRRMPHRHRDV